MNSTTPDLGHRDFQPGPSDSAQLLEISGLSTSFFLAKGRLIAAVRDVSLEVGRGEVVGLVGESGSGKTVLALSVLGLVPKPGEILAGSVTWKGQSILGLPEKAMRRIRGREIAMIFQNPQLSFNPVFPIGRQIAAVLRLHRGLSAADARDEAIRLLSIAGVPEPEKRFSDFAHELSGGLCQRAMIAMAIGCEPQLLIADEPTSSLDVTIQAQIIDLLLACRDRFGMAILLISHDLGVIAQASDRVAVMQAGQIIEQGSAPDIFHNPQCAYTRILLDSVPIPDPSFRRGPR